MGTLLTEFPDRRVWDLSGYAVELIQLSYQVKLFMARSPGPIYPKTRLPYNHSVTVRIETAFTVRVGARIDQIIPEKVLSTVPVLPLLHQKVASLTAFRNGTLLLLFGDGTEMEVQKDDQYESWHTWGEGELADIGMDATGHAGSPWGS
jgi:hypothetical protein